MGTLIDLPNAKSVDQCLKGLIARASNLHGTAMLDLDCGLILRNSLHSEHAYGVDILDNASKQIKISRPDS
jgi:hypothetical protein